MLPVRTRPTVPEWPPAPRLHPLARWQVRENRLVPYLRWGNRGLPRYLWLYGRYPDSEVLQCLSSSEGGRVGYDLRLASHRRALLAHFEALWP